VKKSAKPYVQMKMTGGRMVPHYRLTWQDNGKRKERYIRLPEDMDSAEFDREYWAIRSGKADAVQRPVKQTWAELIAIFRDHPKFKRLGAGTKAPYNRVMNEIAEKNGKKAVASLSRAHIRAIHAKYADTPRKADWMVQVLSRLLNFARLTLDWKVENHAAGIELYGKSREFEPWPEWMVAKLDTAPDTVRTAAELILGTGQRPNAAVSMRYSDFTGEVMAVLDEKAGVTFDVYCPAPLRACIASRKKTGAYVLAKNLAEPIGYDGVEKAFRKWRADLGPAAKGFVLHGLRKLAIVRLAEAGCSDAQIQAVTNQSPEMVAYYRKRANRKVLSRAAHNMVEQNRTKT
jgi:integrase